MEQEIYKGALKLKFVESNHAYYIAEKEGSEWGKWQRKSGATTYGGIKDKIYHKTPSKWTCNFCPFKEEQELCGAGLDFL